VAAFSMGVIELWVDATGDPMGTVGLVLMSVPGTGLGLGRMGVRSAGMVLACIEGTGAGLIATSPGLSRTDVVGV
jgi:hypothetical protein